MVGYAVTCTADSTTESRADERGLLPLWAAVEAAPKPAVIVIKDIGPERSRSCHMGEVMATTAKALGAVGCVSDGGLRDVVEVRALGGFQYFCPGFVVSHGNPVICDVNVPVTLDGLAVQPGDLLHGDVNGVLVIPDGVADRVAGEAQRVRDAERVVLDFVRSPGLTVEKLRAVSGAVQALTRPRLRGTGRRPAAIARPSAAHPRRERPRHAVGRAAERRDERASAAARRACASSGTTR